MEEEEADSVPLAVCFPAVDRKGKTTFAAVSNVLQCAVSGGLIAIPSYREGRCTYVINGGRLLAPVVGNKYVLPLWRGQLVVDLFCNKGVTH